MNFYKWTFLIAIVAILYSCAGENEQNHQSKSTEKPVETISIPDFNADSAYIYVSNQVAFGPRVPNTKEHQQCADYLFQSLQSFTDTALVQKFQSRAFNGTVLNGKNIIGSINPHLQNRILLCAHWDSRPFADYDPDPENHRKPILGANDGASGVGVLLEIARHLKQVTPRIGVDIIFFDLEDYGKPQDMHANNYDSEDFWGLGSQYWSRNPHYPDYYARYGILLDMVGAKNAQFYMEAYSLMYAPGVLKKVWNTAKTIGYGEYFIFEQAGGITDDHYYINKLIGIPTINIIHLDPESANSSFFEHWHTVNDDLDVIDKTSLKAVGQVLLTVIYQEK